MRLFLNYRNLFLFLEKNLLLALIVIPTENLSDWKIDKFSKIPPNIVSASKLGLLVKVKGSAGPIIYPFKAKVTISEFTIAGDFKGLPVFSEKSKQGGKGFDDYALRIGFIVPGEKKLTGLKKLFAPQWVKQLYAQVPEGTGLDHIQFFNVTQNVDQLGQQRHHPASDLIHEDFFKLVDIKGPFNYKYSFKTPLDALAVWISIDGDDTQSEFDVLINKLELNTSELPASNN